MLNEPDSLPRVSQEIGRTLFRYLLLPEETLDTSMTLESIGVGFSRKRRDTQLVAAFARSEI